jgi:hypothetical protein
MVVARPLFSILFFTHLFSFDEFLRAHAIGVEQLVQSEYDLGIKILLAREYPRLIKSHKAQHGLARIDERIAVKVCRPDVKRALVMLHPAERGLNSQTIGLFGFLDKCKTSHSRDHFI